MLGTGERLTILRNERHFLFFFVLFSEYTTATITIDKNAACGLGINDGIVEMIRPLVCFSQLCAADRP